MGDDDMPPQPKTVELKQPTELELLFAGLRAEMRKGFAEVTADNQVTRSEITVVKDEVRALQKWRVEQDERASRNSGGTRQLSENDSKQDAVIATLVTTVAGLVTTVTELKGTITEVHKTVVGVINNPKVRFVGKVLFAAAVAYSGLHGLKVLP